MMMQFIGFLFGFVAGCVCGWGFAALVRDK